MTFATDTVPPERRSAHRRPGPVRRWAAWYLDLLASAWLSWMLCHASGIAGLFASLTAFLLVAQVMWSRRNLRPTLGESLLGIRCLTSSSNQVVADIRVLHPALALNAPLLAAGIVEITLSAAAFSGWTAIPVSVLAGRRLAPPLTLAPWLLWGVLLFVCAGSILSASPKAAFRVPWIHAFLTVETLLSRPTWESLAAGSVTASLGGRFEPASLVRAFQTAFLVWSVVLVAVILAFRGALRNPGKGRGA